MEGVRMLARAPILGYLPLLEGFAHAAGAWYARARGRLTDVRLAAKPEE